jgi:outer membrane protein TolC
VAQVQSRPDLFVEARHDNLLDPLGGGSSLRVGVIFPVGGSAKQRGEVQAAQAVAAEQAATGEETGRVAQLEITTAYNDLLKAQREVQAYQQGRLDEAKQLLAMAQLGYDKGANSYLELLDAQHEYSKAQADYARAQAAYHVALITLQHAVGGQLP